MRWRWPELAALAESRKEPFAVFAPDRHVWLVLDARFRQVEVLMFPLYVTGPAVARMSVTFEALRYGGDVVLDDIARRLAHRLDDMGLIPPGDIRDTGDPKMWEAPCAPRP